MPRVTASSRLPLCLAKLEWLAAPMMMAGLILALTIAVVCVIRARGWETAPSTANTWFDRRRAAVATRAKLAVGPSDSAGMLVFVHMQKCAGTAVEEAIQARCHEALLARPRSVNASLTLASCQSLSQVQVAAVCAV